MTHVGIFWHRTVYIFFFIMLVADRLVITQHPTIRVIQLFYVLAFIFLIRGMNFQVRNLVLFVGLLFYSSLSLFWTYDFVKTAGYVLFLTYNYFFIYFLFYSYAQLLLRERVFEPDALFLFPCRIYIIICFLIMVINFLAPGSMSYFMTKARVQFLADSVPSTACFLSPYIALVFYNYAIEKKMGIINYLDFLFLLLACLSIKSTTLLITIAVSMLGVVWKLSWKQMFFMLSSCVFFLIMLFMNEDASYFLTRLWTLGLSASAQGRVESITTTFDAFQGNMFLGVGMSGLATYRGLAHWGAASHIAPLQMLAELGSIGTALFVLWFLTSWPHDKKFFFSATIYLMFSVGEPNYMVYALWAYLGIWAAINVEMKTYPTRLPEHKREDAGFI